MKQKTKLTALFFALLLCSPLFASCSGGETTSAETAGEAVTETEAETEAETEEETAYTADYLPDVSYDGYEYRLVAYEEYPGHIPELTGDMVEDSIFNRNMLIEERYDIKFSETRYLYDNGEYEKINQLMQTAARAQSDDYDLASLIFRNAFAGVMEGYIPAASSMPIIDMSKPWYVQKLNDKMKVDGINLIAYTTFDKNPGGGCLIFNKNILVDLGLESPYEMVYDGTWMYDVMYSMGTAAVFDINGDGTLSEGDRFGFISEPDNMTDLAYFGSGITLIDFKSTPPQVCMEEKLFDMFTYALQYYTSEGFLMNTFDTWGSSEASRLRGNQYFMEGGSLFMQRGTNTLTILGDMEDDYGILPFPKWTEDQDGYYSNMDGSRVFVPLACSTDLERVCVIKEALAVESLNIVHPAYYENTLTKRYVRDTESIDMLEIITTSNSIDFGAAIWMADVRTPWMNCLVNNNANFASAIAKNVSKNEKAIQELLDIVTDLKQQ